MSPYRVVVFTDLDDSLFQTREKTLARHPAGTLVPAADDRHGAVLSFHAHDQLALLHLLQDAVLIPVTGRNHQALRRVRRPMFSDYRITSHGSMIYRDDETPLPEWYARVRQRADLASEAMHAMVARLPSRLGHPSGLRARVIEDADVPVYVSLKWDDAAAVPAAAILHEAVRTEGLGASWRIHQNGRNVALLPDYASKAEAVRYVMDIKRRTHPHTTFVGVGDSTSDTAFMQLCHFALVPSNSQIQSGWSYAQTLFDADLPPSSAGPHHCA
ncbi:MAG: hypothetical protein K9L70_08025 [Thiohalocapsa sp.]|nr:hypothetical protein [Thiohalocapsa sp.]MCF7990480.1 hypothetical protein [Thiohalocapsa sp.]